ncbi:MAG: hypothetical protein R3336_07535, partial [Phycisphaeraceae bacterium]|nr:hypothetical protein [Phycisphaeraceae bacterium]
RTIRPMPQCNIQARGRAVRLISGLLTLAVAVTLTGLAFFGVIEGTWVWWLAGLLAAGGGFQVYEGWAGWCVVRAMGFSTPF